MHIIKKFISFFTASITLFSAASCEKKGNSSLSPAIPDAALNVTFFDVGKADAILIHCDAGTVVIDCGEKGDGKEIVSELEDQNISTVDYLIITHYDQDHVGGATKLLHSVEVKNVLAPDYQGKGDEYKKYNKTLTETGITPQLLKNDLDFSLGDVNFKVLAPEKDFYGDDDENDFSLVTEMTYRDTSFLFTGDAMEQRLSEIMDIGHFDLLKVPYHGRKLENLAEFLDAVSPQFAVVCTSNDEFSKKVKEMLIERSISTYATCINGKIIASSNGNEIKISSAK